MPRDARNWSGKLLSPPAESAPQPIAPPAPSLAAPSVSCPNCRGELRALASGALGCMTCAAIFQARRSAEDALSPEPDTAIDQMDAINAMLRRNTLVLGPGGVPLAESDSDDNRGGRRRAAQQRRARR